VTDALWVAPGYPWDAQPVGGVFYQTQARALARAGLDITVASPTPWAPWPLCRVRTRWGEYAAAPPIAIDEGVTVVRPRYPNVPGEPAWAAPDRLIARCVWGARASWRGARIVHGHSAVTGLAAWRLARRIRLPLVLTFHGSDLNTWPDHNPDRVPDLRAAVREARAVIAVSAALAGRVEEITGVTAIHLPLGSDHRSLARLARPRDEARATLGLVDERIIVLFVGNLLATKGVREFVDALLTIDDRFFGVIVGDGPERGYGTGDPRAAWRVQYRGAVPHSEIPRYLSAADVLVLPSHGEGLPTVLVEAGSLGLPVIASAVGGIPGLLGDDRGAILREVSSEAIVEALLTFEWDRPAAAAAAARLRSHVLAEHDVDLNARRLLDLYESIGSAATAGSRR
jgi:teichuronic acid biosynthesis glycosyltransferase TuaC